MELEESPSLQPAWQEMLPTVLLIALVVAVILAFLWLLKRRN
jgi:flagellar biogenesis protein FliO